MTGYLPPVQVLHTVSVEFGRMVSQEHGLAEEVLNVVSQFIGVGTTEIKVVQRNLY